MLSTGTVSNIRSYMFKISLNFAVITVSLLIYICPIHQTFPTSFLDKADLFAECPAQNNNFKDIKGTLGFSSNSQ